MKEKVRAAASYSAAAVHVGLRATGVVCFLEGWSGSCRRLLGQLTADEGLVPGRVVAGCGPEFYFYCKF